MELPASAHVPDLLVIFCGFICPILFPLSFPLLVLNCVPLAFSVKKTQVAIVAFQDGKEPQAKEL